MRDRLLTSMLTRAFAVAAVGAVVSVSITRTSAQAPLSSTPAAAPDRIQTTPASKTPALKTPWGEPDLQGIWTQESDIPLQRLAKYGLQEFFTEAQRTELDRDRAALLARDGRAGPGSETDVTQGYSSVFLSIKRIGARTSLISNPPNGRMPPLTPETQKIAVADREFRLALLRSTETCKNKSAACSGGTYDPAPSPRRTELPPRYNTARMNRQDAPEDVALGERCLTGGLPEFGTAFGGSFRRIVQTPGGISIFYDVGQGQGWQRNIIMDGRPHLPAGIRQWYGDSRGHWEGDTLIIDVTNFSPKVDFQGARENLHLVERWTRTGPNTLEYVVTIEDPTVWTRPWTVSQEFAKQSDVENRIYYEPRCIEGNYGLPGLLHGRRMEERAFAEGRGPDPATRDNMTASTAFQDDDPLR
ncbi:MAG TPA: hypothetical protein VK148_17860 [Xanthobacteraceae bacterium]|jgi:hypothetical protein|nr:hypothetical protein [Xanthobacteraceae bacterium]